MGRRLELQALLEQILGSNNVYFQPPASLKMSYPAIRYLRDDIQAAHADNKPYKNTTRYQITLIGMNPDSETHSILADLPLCSYVRFYVADNLNHDVYNLFF